MVLAYSPDNALFAGKGIVYFKPQGQNGFLDLGNVPKLEINPEIGKEDYFSSRRGVKEKAKTFFTQKTVKASLDLHDFSADNINLAFLGDGVQLSNQTDGYLNAVNITTVADRFVPLDKTNLSILKLFHGTVTNGPFVYGATVTGGTSAATAKIGWAGTGFIELVNVVGNFQVGETITSAGAPAPTAEVTGQEVMSDVIALNAATTPTTRYINGTDYNVETIGGLLRELQGAGIVSHAVFVSADHPAKANRSIRALAGTSATGELRFISTGDNGPRYNVQAWKVDLKMSGAIGLIGDDLSKISLEAEFLSDAVNHPNEPFFRATEVA